MITNVIFSENSANTTAMVSEHESTSKVTISGNRFLVSSPTYTLGNKMKLNNSSIDYNAWVSFRQGDVLFGELGNRVLEFTSVSVSTMHFYISNI